MSSGHPYARTSKGFAQILGAARAAGLKARASNSRSVIQKAERDEVVYLALNDPVMAAAIKSARRTLPGFLTLAHRPGPAMKGFSVKISLLASDGPEYFWIDPFARVEEQFIGQINNTPRAVKNLKLGDTVAFTVHDIVDWMYIDDGMMMGNYTARAILKSALPQDREAFKRQFGLDFDF